MAWDYNKEIPVLVLKYETERKKFLFLSWSMRLQERNSSSRLEAWDFKKEIPVLVLNAKLKEKFSFSYRKLKSSHKAQSCFRWNRIYAFWVWAMFWLQGCDPKRFVSGVWKWNVIFSSPLKWAWFFTWFFTDVYLMKCDVFLLLHSGVSMCENWAEITKNCFPMPAFQENNNIDSDTDKNNWVKGNTDKISELKTKLPKNKGIKDKIQRKIRELNTKFTKK